MTLGIDLHFGFTLNGLTPQLSYYDDGTASAFDIWIPPGQYFFKHTTAAKDIRSVVKALIIAAGFPSFDLTTTADRQLTWTMDAAADYVNTINTGDGDDLRLAHALGLYVNDGDLTHFRTNNVTNGYVSNNVLSSWFADGGRTYETASLLGFDVAPAEIYETEGGAMSYASGSKKAVLGPVKFTSVPSDSVRGGFPSGNQAVPGTTLNSTWTTSIWRASWSEYNDPVFYAEIGSTPDKYEFALRVPLKETSARQIRPGWTSNFDLTMDLIRLGDPL